MHVPIRPDLASETEASEGQASLPARYPKAAGFRAKSSAISLASNICAP